MKLFKKMVMIIAMASLLFTPSCSAMRLSVADKVHKTSPREVFVLLKREIIYKVCVDNHRMYDDIIRRWPDALQGLERRDLEKEECREYKSGALASGVHLERYAEPDEGKPASLVLTAGHFCREPESKVPRSIGQSVIPYVTSAEVKWKYTAFDFLGNEIGVHKLIAHSMDADLCLLESDEIPFKPIRIASVKPQYGDRVANISTPYGLFFPPNIMIDEGYYIGETNKGAVMLSDMSGGPGSSGSMLIIERWNGWELVGMLHSVIFTQQSPVGNRMAGIGEPMITLGASLGQITDFIEEHFIKGYLGN